MNAFLTGSHAYGTPRDDSDIDLVVMMGSCHLERLHAAMVAQGENPEELKYEGSSLTACLRFGSLNLLVVTNDADYWAWREGTTELEDRRPVTRDEAVATFTAKREAVKAAREKRSAEDVEFLGRIDHLLEDREIALSP